MMASGHRAARWFAVTVAFVALALVVAACSAPPPAGSGGSGGGPSAGGSAGGAGDGGSGQLTVSLPGPPSARYAGYYAAVDQGFFGEAGLDLELASSPGEQDGVQMVADGKAQLGVSPMMRVMVAQEAGAKLTLVGQIMQRSGVSMVATKDSKIVDARSMKGKRIGVRSDGTEHEVREAIKKAGLSETDVEISNGGVPEFLAGELDAVEVVSFEDLAAIFESPAASGARLTPADVKIFDFNSDFVQTAMIPDAIVANNDWLAANEDAAVAFLVAVGRGWAWCRDSQEACAELSRKNGATGGASHEAFVLNEALGAVWPAFTGIGEIDRTLWALTARTAVAAGLLNGEPAEGAYRIDLAERATEQLDEVGVDKRGNQWEKLDLVPNEGGA